MLRRLALPFLAWLVLGPTTVNAEIADVLGPNYVELENGRRLNLNCVGAGSPTVVFEQGGEGAIVNWRELQPEISKLTRTCFYDRAGFGFSDPPKKPVNGLNATDDLRVLLRKAGIKTPIIIVGHSMGGFYATLYASRFPREVAGLVLVDPGFAGQFDPRDPEQRRRELAAINSGYDWLAGCAEKARRGELSEEASHGCFKIPPNRAPAEKAYLLHMHSRPAWYEAEASQSRNYFPSKVGEEPLSWRQARAARRSFGDMPVVVLSAGVVGREKAHSDEGYAEFVEHWRAGHRELAARSSRGEMIVVPEAKHFIQRDKPGVVIEALGRVLEAARR
ncbi:alpha/beta fold hydrolase [Caulobacter sp. NIBR2454]|uniref:alpha/beta fold hydrolase n=1 Tax=Caulobacter sp. NIBR2454 TaxID=3015996 RepID=UPI0022B746F5|nr:alpha/beta fold hydrolase [Caulobacter sp. NIBR2454]